MSGFERRLVGTALTMVFAGLISSAVGCELIAEVDRSHINGQGGAGGGSTVTTATTSSGGGGGSGGTSTTTSTSTTSTSSSSNSSSSSSGGGGGAGPQCTEANDCPSPANPCVLAACSGGKCGTTPRPSGTPLASQVPGDCKVKQCDGAGTAVDVNDNTDVPVDANPCTDDVCSAGVASHPPAAASTACGNGLVCDGNGVCVGCIASKDCPGVDDECQKRTCMGGLCGKAFTAAGTPLTAQTAGDCAVNQCDGDGGVTKAVLASDLPDDGNECTDDVCTGATPSNPPRMPGFGCNQLGGSLCDGVGTCVTCLVASTCPGQDTECQTRTCTAGGCGIAYMAAGTPVTMQTPGDCKVVQCDGAGVASPVNDDNDLPDDSNPCTADVCTAGVPSHPAKPSGTDCGGTLVCDGTGACTGCSTPATCPGQDTECQTRTCTSNACGFSYTAAGTFTSTQSAGDCKRNQCNGAGLIVAVADNNDVPVDGNACTADVCVAGTPSNPPEAAGSGCAQMGGSYCDGAGVCTECVVAAQCPGVDTDCQTRTCVAGLCGVANVAAGTVTSTQTPYNCMQNQCDGTGSIVSVVDDTDVPVDGLQCTSDVCSAGVPSNPSVAAGVSCTQGGTVCNGAGACVECVNGSTCSSGVCTNNTCQPSTCADGIKNGSETGTDCGGPCPTHCALGGGCSAAADCTSGICTNNVCSQVNGCDYSNATVLTGMSSTSVTFGGGAGLNYTPKCIKVTVGTNVTFNGSFSSHPLVGGEVLAAGTKVPSGTGPFTPMTSTGTTATFTLSTVGAYPYYCNVHALSGMTGAVFVVP